MRKIILFSIVLISSFKAYSQDYLGLTTGNYSGVQGLLLQPANVADSRYKFDINVFSTSFNFDNNYLGFSRNYFLNNRFSFKDFKNFEDFKQRVLIENNLKGNSAYFNINNRINLPSFMVSLGKNAGIGLGFQSRTAIGIKNVNPEFASQVYNIWKDSANYNQVYNVGGLDITGLNWFEAGLTFGHVLLNKNKHFVKAGITAKYLGGISSLYFNSDDLQITAQSDTFLYAKSSHVNYGHSASNISPRINSSYRPDASSWGYDLGVVYEFRGRINKFKFLKYDREDEEIYQTLRRDKNKYSVKLGLSLLDVGTLKFQSVSGARDFSIDKQINLWAIDVRNVNDFDAEIAKHANFKSVQPRMYSVAMPTALSAQLDVHLIRGFYLNAMAYKPFTALNKDADYRVYTPDYYAVTPRWESRFAGVYVPFVMNSHKEISAGATLRLGPVFVGTSNMLTLIQKENITNADLHAGVKIPLAHGKPSKASRWFTNFTRDDKEEDQPEEIKEVKEIEETHGDTKVIKEEKVIEKKIEESVVRPINITINNYHGGSVPSGTQVISLDQNGNQIPVDTTIQQGGIRDLKEQIEYLKWKLKQKEELINEMNEEKRRIDLNMEEPEGKKKIRELTENYLRNNQFEYTGTEDEVNYSEEEFKEELGKLTEELTALEEKNSLLDQKLNRAITSNYNLLEINRNNKAYVERLEKLNTSYKALLEQQPVLVPVHYQATGTSSSVQESTKVYGENNRQNTYSYPSTNSVAATPLNTSNLMTKDEYRVLRSEIESLKLEWRNYQKNASAVKPVETTKSEIVKDGNKVMAKEVRVVREIIHDTIYIDKPAEVVTKVVYDTITQTIEKQNTVTKVETQVIDNDKENLLAMPPMTILFDIGKYNIKSVYYRRLNFYAEQMKTYGNELRIQLTGYTDKSGSPEKNLILSRKRAKSVSDYLISKGVSSERITVEGLGDENPISDNKTVEGKSQNRRVEVIFIR